jgi:hypothetical protein
MNRSYFTIVVVFGNERRKRRVWTGREKDAARFWFNRIAAKAKPDTQVRLYQGDELVSCTGGDPDLEKGEALDEKEQRDVLRSTGDFEGWRR